jgi:hypothetical protein
MLAGVAERPGADAMGILWRRSHGTRARVFLLAAVVAAGLALALPHANVPSDTDTAALVGHRLAELSALHQSRELLGAENMERRRLDLHPPIHTRRQVGVGGLEVEILFFLGRLEKAELEFVVSLMANRQVREDKVAGFVGTIQVGHAGGGNTSQNGRVVVEATLARVLLSCIFETGVEEEMRIVVESDVLALIPRLSFDDAQLNHWRRVNGTSVAVGYSHYQHYWDT